MRAKLTMRSSASIVRSTEALRIALTTYGVVKPIGILTHFAPREARLFPGRRLKVRGGTDQASVEPLASIKCERIRTLGGAGVLRQ